MSGHTVSEILLHGSAQSTVPTRLWAWMAGRFDSGGSGSQSSLWSILTSPAPINYCEADYVQSPYIAEFYNTLTNGAFLLFGLYALRQCQRYGLPGRFAMMAWSLVLTACGSALYHCTLTWIGLKTDEISETGIFIALVHLRSPTAWPWVHALLAAFAILFVHVFLFTELHLLSLGLTTIIQNFRHIRNVPAAWSAWIRGFVFSLLGELAWLLDHLYCDTAISALQLHAWWHIFMALCIHQLFVVAVIVHAPQSVHAQLVCIQARSSDSETSGGSIGEVRLTIRDSFGLVDWLTPIAHPRKFH